MSFASREAFEDFVRAGDLSPDDLVYDGETGSWSSALTHPLVLELQYEEEAAAEAAAAQAASAADGDGGGEEDHGSEPLGTVEHDGDGDPSHPDGDGGEEGLGLSLAPARAVEPKARDDSADSSLPEIERPVVMPSRPLDVEDSDEGGTDGGEDPTVEGDDPVPHEGAPELDVGTGGMGLGVTMENRGSLGEMLSTPTTGAEPEAERPKPAAKPKARPTPAAARKESGGIGRWIAAAAVVGVLGAGGYFGLTGMGNEAAQPSDGMVEQEPAPVEVEPEPEPPPPQPTIATSEAAVQERARERYLTGSQAVLRDLEPIPPEWATAEYFASPSSYPEIPGLWEPYITAMQLFRAGDRERYTTAFEAALDDAAIRGEQRAERAGRAMARFDAGAAARAAHFDRVVALASAAIQSHSALVEAEGLILIDPSGPIGIQSGIGRGAYGRDPDSQLLLDQVVEVLNETLRADGAGPVQGVNVREWVWSGFLDAVTTGS